jgi:hypothetical protein
MPDDAREGAGAHGQGIQGQIICHRGKPESGSSRPEKRSDQAPARKDAAGKRQCRRVRQRATAQGGAAKQ